MEADFLFSELTWSNYSNLTLYLFHDFYKSNVSRSYKQHLVWLLFPQPRLTLWVFFAKHIYNLLVQLVGMTSN